MVFIQCAEYDLRTNPTSQTLCESPDDAPTQPEAISGGHASDTASQYSSTHSWGRDGSEYMTPMADAAPPTPTAFSEVVQSVFCKGDTSGTADYFNMYPLHIQDICRTNTPIVNNGIDARGE